MHGFMWRKQMMSVTKGVEIQTMNDLLYTPVNHKVLRSFWWILRISKLGCQIYCLSHGCGDVSAVSHPEVNIDTVRSFCHFVLFPRGEKEKCGK